jgi:hypothetical protein
VQPSSGQLPWPAEPTTRRASGKPRSSDVKGLILLMVEMMIVIRGIALTMVVATLDGGAGR